MPDGGYVLLHRSLLSWEWYTDLNTKCLFLHLLLTVNWEDKQWRGQTIQRGQRVCSLEKLSKETGLSIQRVRTALNHLKSTGEITCYSRPQSTMITVLNYDKYQQLTCQLTSEQQTTNIPSTNDQQQLKELKERKRNKKEKTLCAFDEFWASYPKKRSKGEALKAWKKINPDSELVAKILQGVARAKTCHDWTKEGGRYIPYPATWLNRMGWEDELSVAPAHNDGPREDSL